MSENSPPLSLVLILRILSALLNKLYEAECLIHVDTEGRPVSGQPPVKVDVGGIDTESVSNRFFLGKTIVTHGKFHSSWECMTNFLETFSEEHRMPTVYQVRQVRAVLLKYRLAGEGGED